MRHDPVPGDPPDGRLRHETVPRSQPRTVQAGKGPPTTDQGLHCQMTIPRKKKPHYIFLLTFEQLDKKFQIAWAIRYRPWH